MIVINTGATANDGLGDKLRDAFIIVNENFSNIQDILDVVLTDSSIISISQISGLQTILDDLSYQVSLIPSLQDDINSINSTIYTINQTLNSQNGSISDLYSLVNDLQQQIYTKIGDAPIDGEQYVRQDGEWIILSNQIGPTGPTGATGSQGIQGVTGATGASGIVIRRHSFTNFDGSNSYDYNGYAPVGSSESSNVWTITRLTINEFGSVTRGTTSSVAWTDRAIVIYT